MKTPGNRFTTSNGHASTRIRAALRWGALPAAALLTGALLAACGDGDREGGQCEPCRGETPRCDSGLSCQTFSSGATITTRCASSGTTTCPLVY
jgi:hypothetical protein